MSKINVQKWHPRVASKRDVQKLLSKVTFKSEHFIQRLLCWIFCKEQFGKNMFCSTFWDVHVVLNTLCWKFGAEHFILVRTVCAVHVVLTMLCSRFCEEHLSAENCVLNNKGWTVLADFLVLNIFFLTFFTDHFLLNILSWKLCTFLLLLKMCKKITMLENSLGYSNWSTTMASHLKISGLLYSNNRSDVRFSKHK